MLDEIGSFVVAPDWVLPLTIEYQRGWVRRQGKFSEEAVRRQTWKNQVPGQTTRDRRGQHPLPGREAQSCDGHDQVMPLHREHRYLHEYENHSALSTETK